MIYRAFRFRLEPTPAQADLFWQFAGVTRLIYNLALEQRRDFWRQHRAATGSVLNYVSQGREVSELRRHFDWMAAVPRTPLTCALLDLDAAFSAFFAGRSRYPQPRRKGINDAFRFRAVDVDTKRLNGRWSAIRVPKVGWVKFRCTRAIAGGVASANIAHDALGWHVSFTCKIEHEAEPSNLPAVGIDRGVVNTLALSTGEMLSAPTASALEKGRKRAQRALCRRTRGSNRYRKQRQHLSRIAGKLARIRACWRHNATLGIAQRFGTVAIEALPIANMTASGKHKRGLNRSILKQGWGTFERVLSYKLEDRGGTLIKVNPAYTSQECSSCGVIDKLSRESQASFACRSCGFTDHADTNAAKNILRRSTAGVEDAGCGSVEARTINLARLGQGMLNTDEKVRIPAPVTTPTHTIASMAE